MSSLDNHRLLFCISSGRAGSEYLARLLALAPRVLSFHEVEPQMIGPYVDMINNAPYSASFGRRQIKSAAIKEILLNTPPGTIYSETSHMFIKTFFDVVVEDFANIEVIMLRRELARVLKSFIELCYFSPRNTVWPSWMSLPNAATSASICIDDFAHLDHYDRVIAYLIDIEARALRFRSSFPFIKVHEIRVEALSNDSDVIKFFEDLRFPAQPVISPVIGKSINQRVDVKTKFSNPADIDYCRERIVRYIEKAESQGIALPDTLALEPYSAT